MDTNEAIMAFSQSEKVKSGLIWVSQALEALGGLREHERKGAEKAIHLFTRMVFQEVRLARKIAGHGAWEQIEKEMDQAMVMIDSGVATECAVQLTRALSLVTNIGHHSMTFLKERGLL